MAITIDQASLFTPFINSGGSTSITATTTATVASNALIIVTGGLFDPTVTASSLSADAGALTGSLDIAGRTATLTAEYVFIGSIPAVSGLASGEDITVALSGSAAARTLHAFSVLGADLTGSRVDATSAAIALNPGASWTTGSMSTDAGSIVIGSSWREDGNATPQSTTSHNEIADWAHAGDAYGQTWAYRIEASGGSYTVSGTWAATVPKNTTVGVAYLAAAGGGAASGGGQGLVRLGRHRGRFPGREASWF